MSERKNAMLRNLTIFLLLTTALTYFSFKNTGTGLFEVKLFMIFLVSYSLVQTLLVLANKKIDKFELTIITVIFIVALPLLIKGFYFWDDFEIFPGYYIDFFSFSISQGRQIPGLFFDLMHWITVESSYVLKYFAVTGWIIYSILLYRWIMKFSKQKYNAMLFTIILSMVPSIINIVGYGTMFVYTWTLVFTAVAVHKFKMVYDVYTNKTYNYKEIVKGALDVVILLLTAYFIYSVLTTVLFLFVLISLVLLDEHKKNKPISFEEITVIIYGLATVIYFVSVRVISKFSGIHLLTRSGIIYEFSSLIEKLKWFFDVVFQENIKQAVFMLTGQDPFYEYWSYYLLTFKIQQFNSVIPIALGILVVVGLLSVKTKRRKFEAILCIPGAYYPFLILSENSYTSYYSVGLTSVVVFLIVAGLISICNMVKMEWIGKYEKYKLIVVTTCVAIILIQAFYYISTFWVDYNSSKYEYLKSSISEYYNLNEVPLNRIHIYGSLFPQNAADIYMIKACHIALDELGYSRDEINVTVTTNTYMSDVISKKVYEEMQPMLSPSDIEKFHEYYYYSDGFSIYTIDWGKMDEDAIENLKDIYIKANLIPQKNEGTLEIDLSSVSY